MEGKKRWRLYAPTTVEHVLPRYSSRDFLPEELGPCVLDTVLLPGEHSLRGPGRCVLESALLAAGGENRVCGLRARCSTWLGAFQLNGRQAEARFRGSVPGCFAPPRALSRCQPTPAAPCHACPAMATQSAGCLLCVCVVPQTLGLLSVRRDASPTNLQCSTLPFRRLQAPCCSA